MLFIKSISFFLFLSLIVQTAYADFYIEERITTNIHGKLLKGVKKTYITNCKVLLIDPTLSVKTIFDYNDNKVFLINDARKDINVHSLNKFNLPINENIDNDFAILKEKDIYVKKSDRKRKIRKYDCYELVVYVPRISALTKVWITDDPGLELDPYYSFIERHARNIQLKYIVSFLRLKNSFIAESSTTIVRPKEPERYFKAELLNISPEKIPADIFILPAGYRIISN